MEIDSSTGESTSSRSPRFTLWAAFCMFSVVAMGAAIDVNETSDTAAAKYVVACSILTVILTGLVSLAHFSALASVFVVGTVLEGFLSLSLAALWSAAVAVVTNTSQNLATSQSSTNQVTNGNLYYFSIACFFTSIILLTNYIRAVFGVDVVGELRNRGARISLWAALLATSLVVAGSSGRVNQDDCQDREATDFEEDVIQQLDKLCKRTKFGIAVGSITVLLSVAVVAMKMYLGTGAFAAEFVMAVFLAIFNAFGVAYITSNDGPGAPIGNLYYTSWGSFLLAGFLAAECFGEYKGLTGAAAAGNSNGHNESSNNGHHNKPNSGTNGDLQVETMDDDV